MSVDSVGSQPDFPDNYAHNWYIHRKTVQNRWPHRPGQESFSKPHLNLRLHRRSWECPSSRSRSQIAYLMRLPRLPGLLHSPHCSYSHGHRANYPRPESVSWMSAQPPEQERSDSPDWNHKHFPHPLPGPFLCLLQTEHEWLNFPEPTVSCF